MQGLDTQLAQYFFFFPSEPDTILTLFLPAEAWAKADSWLINTEVHLLCSLFSFIYSSYVSGETTPTSWWEQTPLEQQILPMTANLPFAGSMLPKAFRNTSRKVYVCMQLDLWKALNTSSNYYRYYTPKLTTEKIPVYL